MPRLQAENLCDALKAQSITMTRSEAEQCVELLVTNGLLSRVGAAG